MKSIFSAVDWIFKHYTVEIMSQYFCSFSAQCMRSRFECIHICAGVYGRSPHVDLPLVAAVGAVDENERGQSEDEGSEEGRLYKEL